MGLAYQNIGVIPTHPTDGVVVVKLSKLGDGLEADVPDSADLYLGGSVYAILGADEENPDCTGDEISPGTYNEELDDLQRIPGLKITLSREKLEKFSGQTVLLRYQTIGESGFTMSSPPLKLSIEP
jgi:hypothetical protein